MASYDIVTNDVTAIQPEVWSSMVQVPLYKSLVAMEVANTRLSDTVKYNDTVHIPYFGDLSAQTYTPGTNLTATNQDWHYDTIVVSTYKHCTFYVDNPRALTMNVDAARELAGEAAYQLKNQIDTSVFNCITGADGFTGVDNADMMNGTAKRPVSAGTGNIIAIFAGARRTLRVMNVEENVPWCAVVSPNIASFIEIKAAGSGYNVADSTLRNGYAGDFMGFEVYVSNNLPSGKCTAIAPSAQGGCGDAASATSCKSIYFGQKGLINLIMLKSPALEIRNPSNKIGSNFITWTVYGSGITTKSILRGLNCPVQSGYY